LRIGLLGGSFDPIHLGHLRTAENAREGLHLDLVVLMPAASPPHRPAPLASAFDRYAMVALAAAGHPALLPSDLELRRDGPSYTVDTLEALGQAHPGAELVLIVGSDNLAKLGEWRQLQRIMELATLAVVERPGARAGTDAALPAGRVRRVPGSEMPISSQDLRQRVKEGRSIRYLTPAAVAEYIDRRGLDR